MHTDFDGFFRAEYSSVVRALTLALGSRAHAEDAAQHGFYEALRRWRRVSRMGNPVGWVYVVAIRFARRSTPELLAAEPTDEAVATGHGESGVDDRLAIDAAVRLLTARQRSVFVLRHIGGVDVAEIASSFGISASTVRVLDHQARTTLQKHLSTKDAERMEAPTDAI